MRIPFKGQPRALKTGVEWLQRIEDYTTTPINLLIRNSDENEISLYIITICSNNQVMRILKVITKDKMHGYLDKFSLTIP